MAIFNFDMFYRSINKCKEWIKLKKGLCMIIGPNGNMYTNYISKKDAKFYDRVFRDCQKNVKNTEVRDADWGIYAAQTCLARDLVYATSKEEADFLKNNLDYLKEYINGNMAQDQKICREDEEDARLKMTAQADAQATKISAKADAKAKTLPATSELIKTTPESAKEVLDSSAKLVKEVIPGGSIIKGAGKILDKAA